MRPKHLIALLFMLALTTTPSPAHAGGVVSVCDEAHLRTALAGGGSVTFACNGTITLAATIAIAANATIDGSGRSVTISGNHTVGVFYVNPGIALNLNVLTIANGNAGDGGGIYNDGGTVTVSDSTFSDNSAGSVGGAISNLGTVTVSDCMFTGNSADGGGGGLYNAYYTALTVRNSTFSGNTTPGFGGAISNSSFNAVTISNSTFADNSAQGGGGAIWNGYNRVLVIINSTLSGNSSSLGGTIYNNGNSMTLKNTIVANSQGSGNCEGNAVTDGGGNLSFPDATCPGVVANPVLGPLQNNGGHTLTMALGAGSAAIDTAIDAICAAAPVNNLDQRGVSRPQGAHCDIGAFEVVQGATATPTATQTPTVTPTPTATPTSSPAVHAIYLPMIVR